MTPTRIFLSFDLEHDQDLHDRLLAESGVRPSFAISDQSEGGPITKPWTERARQRISASDEVVIICGEHSNKASRMSAELRIAQEMKKPYVLLWGRRQHMCKKPKSALPGDGMYLWTPEILEDQIALGLSWSRRPTRKTRHGHGGPNGRQVPKIRREGEGCGDGAAGQAGPTPQPAEK